MRRLYKLLHLPPAERGLLIRTALLLSATRLGLWVLPFSTVRSCLDRLATTSAGSCTAGRYSADQIARAVAVASRYIPGATCLTQAMAGQVLLERTGLRAQLRIGVARSGEQRLQAHAWVECQGNIVIGESEARHHTRLPPFDGADPSSGATLSA